MSAMDSESKTNSAAHAGRMTRLVGRLIFAGDLEVNGEEISGVAVEMDRATLIAAAELPMYRECIVLRLDRLTDLIQDWKTRSANGGPESLLLAADELSEILANVESSYA